MRLEIGRPDACMDAITYPDHTCAGEVRERSTLTGETVLWACDRAYDTYIDELAERRRR